MNFKKELHKYLKNNGIKKYKFSQSIGVSSMTLHRYCENEAKIPKKVKLAIMYETNNIIHFEELENGKHGKGLD